MINDEYTVHQALISGTKIKTFVADRVRSRSQILERYEGQGKVERIFRFIKHPAWLGAFCLKRPERIAALGYVLLLAAWVYVLGERRVRDALSVPDAEPIEGLNRQKTTRPTSYALRSVLTPIMVLSERSTDEYRFRTHAIVR